MLNTTRLLSTAALAVALFTGAASAHDYVPLQSSQSNTSAQMAPTSTPDAIPPETQTYYNPTPATAPAPSASYDKTADKMEAHVETRIRTLHDGLKITPEQESLFATVAQTMRDNEATMVPLYEARKNSGQTSAIENLRNHQQLSAAYADSFNKFIASFEPLYNSFSDSQKQSADHFFASEDYKMHGMHKHAMKKKWTKSSKTKATTPSTATTPAQ